jgi:PKD repeat protein
MLVIFCHNLCNAQELTFTVKSMPANELGHATSFGSSLVDFNLDGRDDITVTNFSGNDYSYLNNGNSYSAGSNAITGKSYPSSGLTWGDFNNDSDPDLFISTQGPNNHLFQNDGYGGFVEVLEGPHIEEQLLSSHATWVDIDNDGWLDLFLANTQSFSAGGGAPNSLFLNNEGTSFTKITEGEIVSDKQNSMCGNWADIDNDGDQDLLSLNMGDNNFLYLNNGDGTFMKSTDPAITNNQLFSISCSWVDCNNDGYLDVYIGNGGFRSDTNYLFMNNGDATFTKITEGDIVNTKLDTWNSLWGDLDNDGDQDMIEVPISTRCILYVNNGNGSFSSSELDLDYTAMCSGAMADLDKDGDLDFLLNSASRQSGNIICYNDGNSNNWVQVDYKGITGSGIGARVKLKANINGKPVWQIREITGNTAFRSQNSLRLHFGLGDATTIDSLVFYLPSTNFEIVKTNLDVNQFYTIEEPLPERYLYARFKADTLEGVKSVTVNFTDISMADPNYPITSWKWDFDNDGIIDSEEQHPSFQYSTDRDTLYTVKLIISNGSDEMAFSIPEYIKVYESEFTNIALNASVYSSSDENESTLPGFAVDGISSTRWSSRHNDPQWIMVDLEDTASVGGVLLDWEAAFAREFTLYISTDSLNWTEIYATTEGQGGSQKISFDPIGTRFVMLHGIKRSTPYGYSLYEFGVFDRLPFGTFTKRKQCKPGK